MANVQLTGNFLATARCLIFADGGGITWTFNPNTNTLQASGSGGGVTGLATPTAKVGLTAVAGSLLTAMRSDGAPALDQSIVPTWTGLHTFNAGLTVGGGAFTLSGHTLVLSANASVGGTNTGDQTLPTGASPSASVGLAAVNGIATTWMRSDGSPALSLAIVPVWTGEHTFAGSTSYASAQVGVTLGRVGTLPIIILTSPGGGTDSKIWDNYADTTTQHWRVINDAGNVGNDWMAVTRSGTTPTGVTLFAPLGVNGNSPPAKVTGWGTPTGGTVVASFAAGGTPSLLQMSEAVAQIISDLKAFGLYGA